MQVRCPHCETIFKVADEQLNIADGMVRCGFCKEVFNARTHNTEETEQSSVAPEPPAEEAVVETMPEQPSPEKPGSTAAPTPQPERAASSRPGAQQTRVETEVEEDFFAGVQSKLIPDEFRIPEIRSPYSAWRDIAWSLAILVLTISLFAEYAWFNRNELATRPELSNGFRQLCETMDCYSLDLRDPRQIEMVARNIYSHPNISDALMISITMVNHASFPQPYPRVNIDFSDVRGQVIASRVFKPEEYLQLSKNSIKPLKPGESTDFHLEIQDPGPQAMTYEFKFL